MPALRREAEREGSTRLGGPLCLVLKGEGGDDWRAYTCCRRALGNRFMEGSPRTKDSSANRDGAVWDVLGKRRWMEGRSGGRWKEAEGPGWDKEDRIESSSSRPFLTRAEPTNSRFGNSRQ